jgi:DNA-binding MarR family transcriptional regulator
MAAPRRLSASAINELLLAAPKRSARHGLCNISQYDMNTERLRRLSTDEYRSLATFRRSILQFARFSEAAAARQGLEARQYQLLLMLRGLGTEGRASVSDVAEWPQVRHHSAVGLIDRVARRGMIDRRDHPTDRRRVLVALTTAGEHALSSLAVSHREELRRLAPALVEALQQLLRGEDPSPLPTDPDESELIHGLHKF